MRRVAVDRATRWYQLPPDPDQFVEIEWGAGLNRRRPLVDLTAPNIQPSNDSLSLPNIAELTGGQHREIGICRASSVGLLFHMLCLAILEPGDLALIPDPAEPRLRQSIILAGGNAVTYSLATRSGWSYDFGNLRGDIARQARFIVLGWPQVPTGLIPSSDELETLVNLALRENLLLVIDATHLSFSTHFSAPLKFLELARCAVIFVRETTASASNAVMIGHRDAVSAVETILRSCDALLDPPFENPNSASSQFTQKLRTARSSMLAALERLPVDWSEQDSIPYLWGKIRRRRTSMPLVRLLHRRYGIKILPGHAFGESATAWVAVGLTEDISTQNELTTRIAKRPRFLQLLGEEQRQT